MPASTRSSKGAAKLQRTGPANHEPLGALFSALVVFLVVTFLRPQDVIPALAAIKPGLLAVAMILLLWMRVPDKFAARDAIVKWHFVLLAVMIVGVTQAVNQFHWFWANVDLLIYIVGFALGMPVALASSARRLFVLRLITLSMGYIGLWSITHEGKGPNSYFGDENDVAGALIVGGSLAFWLGRLDPRRGWRWCAMATCVLAIAGIVATQSRGGFLGLAASVIAILLLSGRLLRASLATALIVMLVLPFIPGTYKHEVQSISDPTDSTRQERLYSWGRAIDLFFLSPVIGIGAGNYPWRIGEVEQTPDAIAARGNRRVIAGRAAHSLYFTLLPETGAIGTLSYFSMLFLILRRGYRTATAPVSRLPDPSLRVIGLFLLTAGIGYSVAAAFISVLWFPFFWLFAGLAVLLAPQTKVDAGGNIVWQRPSTKRQRRISGGA